MFRDFGEHNKKRLQTVLGCVDEPVTVGLASQRTEQADNESNGERNLLMFLSRRLASVPLVSKVPQVTTSTSRMLLQDRMAAVMAIAFACASPKSRRATSSEQTQGHVWI